MTLWLYVHFPALQLDSLFESQQQEARNLVVVDGRQNSVVQCNAAARDAGISLGMGLATAAALCRDLQVIPYEPSVEVEKLREIARWLYQVTAEIAVYEPDGLLLRVSPMLKLYGDLAGYEQAVRAQLDAMQVRYHYASGHTPFAAKLLAQAGFDQLIEDPHPLQAAWSHLPLACTDLTSKEVAALRQVGMHTLADLLVIPLKALSRRFEIGVVNYLGKLTGQLKHPVDFYHPETRFQHSLELLHEVSDSQRLHYPLTHLLNLLEKFLRRRDQVTEQITLTLYQRDTAAAVLAIGSAQGEYRADKWLQLAQLTLEGYPFAAPVYMLGLRVDQYHPKATSNSDLFAGRQGKLTDLQLVSLLQALLGKEQVSGLCLVNDFRPERASASCTPLQPSSPPAVQALPLRPSLLLAQPLPLQELVAIIHGPERIATGWWDTGALMRDYYIARTNSGQWCWVFKTGGANGEQTLWYMHGYFS